MNKRYFYPVSYTHLDVYKRQAVATGLLALSLSTGAQERPTALASNEPQPILLAQANVEDGRTGPYSAIVPQVKG